MKELKSGKVLLVILHLGLGVMAAYSNLLASVWGYIFFFYSVDRIIRHRNSDEWAFLASAYMVGIEIVFRMSNAYVPSEFGKYGICALLMLGLVAQRDKQTF